MLLIEHGFCHLVLNRVIMLSKTNSGVSMHKTKTIKRILFVLLCGAVLCGAAFLIINAVVIGAAAPYISTNDDIDGIEKADCILVLGALVYDESRLSPILKDRVETAVRLYEAGKANRLLLSGDHGQKDYDEVNAMMHYAVSRGVPREDIFLDHAGFSTYESLYRARDVFCVESVIIVTQQFHLSRSVYIARGLGLDAHGVSADLRRYADEQKNNTRESFARLKDFFYVNIFLPKPKYLGDAIPIYGESHLTHDKG